MLPPGKVSRVDVNSHASAHAMEPKSESPRTSQGRRPTRIFDADSDSHRRIVSDDHLLTVDPGADPSSGGGGGGGTPRRQRSSETIIISENDHTGSPRPLRKKVDVSRDGGLERGEASLSNGAEDDKGGEPRATGGSCGGQAPKAPEFQEVVAALALVTWGAGNEPASEVNAPPLNIARGTSRGIFTDRPHSQTRNAEHQTPKTKHKTPNIKHQTPKEDKTKVLAGMRKLISLTVDDGGHTHVNRVADSLEDVLAAMQRHRSEPLVQEKALKLVINLIYHSSAVAEHMVEADAG